MERRKRRANGMTNFAKAVEEMLKKGETVENLNKAIHIALDLKSISMKEFREAARVLAKEIINR